MPPDYALSLKLPRIPWQYTHVKKQVPHGWTIQQSQSKTPIVTASAKQSWTQQGLGRKAEFPAEQRSSATLRDQLTPQPQILRV